jgi:hypothetical protein
MKTMALACGVGLAVAMATVVASSKAKAGIAAPAIIRVGAATNPVTVKILPAPGAVAAPGFTNQGPTTRYLLKLPPGKTLSPRAPAGTALKPGVYEAAPYTAIIIFPPPCAEEARMIIRPKKVDPDMPMLQPKLQFVPHKPGP